MGRNFSAAIAMGILGATPSALAEKPSAGVSLSVQISQRIDDSGGMMPLEPGQVTMTAETVLKRLKAMGYAKTRIESKTAKGFHVRIADAKPAESSRIASALQRTARLELREVHPRSEERGSGDKTLARRVMDGEEIVPGYRAYLQTFKDEDGNEIMRPILLNRRVAISGNDIAVAAPSPVQKDAVAVTLNANGADKMVALTKNMQPGTDRIAILLDGEVLTAPVLVHVPLGKHFQIDGLGEPGEVENIAHALMCPLEFPIVVEEFPATPAAEKAE